jgi:hypothetical protein
METDGCASFGEGSDFVNEKSEEDLFFLFWVTENAGYFELVVREYGFVFEAFVYSADIDLFMRLMGVLLLFNVDGETSD